MASGMTSGMASGWTRREFALGVAAAGVAAVGSGAVSGVRAEEVAGVLTGHGGVRLGVASYSFHRFYRADVISMMGALGCGRINAKDVLDHLPMTPEAATSEAVAAYKAAGLELTGCGVVYFAKAEEADVRAKFEYVRRAGLRLVVGSPTPEALPVVARMAREFDVRVAIHNHGPEDKLWPSPLDVLAALEPKGGRAVDEHVGLCVDVGHTARTGTDVVKALRAAGRRLFAVHMKDLADMRVKDSQVAVGDGKMPVAAIFEALATMGYAGTVDLEYEIHEDDPLPGMVKSMAYMRGVLAGMGRG